MSSRGRGKGKRGQQSQNPQQGDRGQQQQQQGPQAQQAGQSQQSGQRHGGPQGQQGGQRPGGPQGQQGGQRQGGPQEQQGRQGGPQGQQGGQRQGGPQGQQGGQRQGGPQGQGRQGGPQGQQGGQRQGGPQGQQGGQRQGGPQGQQGRQGGPQGQQGGQRQGGPQGQQGRQRQGGPQGQQGGQGAHAHQPAQYQERPPQSAWVKPQPSQTPVPIQQHPQQQPAHETKKQISPEPQQSAPSGAAGDAVTQIMQSVTIPQGATGDRLALAFKLPKPGELCKKKIQVYTNHFPLKIGKIKTITKYDVAADPDKPKRAMRVVMEAFKNRNFKNIAYAYDGSKSLYVPNSLPFEQKTDEFEIEVDGRNKKYSVSVKKVQVINMTEIQQFFDKAKSQQIIPQPQSAIQALDTIMRQSYSAGRISVGRSIFAYPKRGDSLIDLGDGMQLYHGMFQSAILGQWKPFLNVDVAHKAFPRAQKVTDLIMSLGRGCDLRQPLDNYTLDDLRKFMKTLQVEYEIPNCPTSKKIYRVNDVDRPPGEIKFKKDDKGPEITVIKYFAERGYSIQYPNMPCLWVGSRNGSVKVPAELCTILPGQPINRKCNAQQTSNMIRFCATNTDERKRKIQDKLKDANYGQDPTLKAFDISIGTDFEKLDARVLNPPPLNYKQSRCAVNRGVWNGGLFYQAGTAMNWTFLSLERRVSPQDIERAVKEIKGAATALGLNLDNYVKYTSMSPRFGREIPELQQYFSNQIGKVDLIFVIIPDRPPKMYSFVKQVAEVQTGCLTQCIKSFTFSRKFNRMTVNNILLKVNTKLNGSNHVLGETLPVFSKPIMIMGADVTHPAPGDGGSPSVAAVTASHDARLFRYNICWRLQPGGTEIITDLENIVREHLLYFYKSNRQAKPEKIIMFRDGVSTGQFEEVMRAELLAIRRACTKLEQDYKPLITFLVVQKRHHTRLFPVNPRDSEDKNFNVPAGTCVDTNITSATLQDFYLVSHASIQGVAKPTKYVTLFDDNDFSNDVIEQLTFYLCHMFARCNRSVSYPAPTYYAHLAAARAKAYCDAVNVDLRNLARTQNNLTIKECIVKEKPMFFV